jgi:hypothetical protein
MSVLPGGSASVLAAGGQLIVYIGQSMTYINLEKEILLHHAAIFSVQ